MATLCSSRNPKVSELHRFSSRRSDVSSTTGMCSSSQPLASAIGSQILAQGGNAADAAVAMAAALNVTEPCSTGIGGDAFALYFDASTGKTSCLLGNGASAARTCAPGTSAFAQLLSSSVPLAGYGNQSPSRNPPCWHRHSGYTVTVPGAAKLWEDLVDRHGTMPLRRVLDPAIQLARKGFPVGQVTAEAWAKGTLQGEEARSVFLVDNATRAPMAGEVFRNERLAQTFTRLAESGAHCGFYTGPVAEAVVAAVAEFGGVLSLADLASHTTEVAEPLWTDYRGRRVYQVPPPTHGVAVLEALQILLRIPGLTSTAADDNGTPLRSCPEQVHAAVEAFRIAMSDALQHVADCESNAGVLLLQPKFLDDRAALYSAEMAVHNLVSGDPTPFLNSETVYFCCVDRHGNACSMINSNYMGFGSGISPVGCGFTLQNRGFNFNVTDPNHPNALGPSKKPYHTIIPCLVTTVPNSVAADTQGTCDLPHHSSSDGKESLYAVLGNMGGFMQPMGHVQLIRNLIDFRMSPQAAVDAPRWYVCGTGDTQSASDVAFSRLVLETGYGGIPDGADESEEVQLREALRRLGHEVGEPISGAGRSLFGKAQVIRYDPHTGVATAGSDPRSDGCAIPCPI